MDGTFSGPELRNIGRAFKARNYYTVLKGGEPSDIVEREFYGKIDDYWGKVLPQITEQFANGAIPTFSGASLDSLRLVLFEMIKRTPDFVSDYDDVKIGREAVENTIEALEAQENLASEYQAMKDALKSETSLRAYGRSVRVRATIGEPSPKIRRELENFVVRWAKSDTRHSFVLSSRIAYRIGNGGSNGLVNPNMEIWMPITPKLALVLLRDSAKKIPIVVPGKPDLIRDFNEHAIRTSLQLGSHSRRLLNSLIRDVQFAA